MWGAEGVVGGGVAHLTRSGCTSSTASRNSLVSLTACRACYATFEGTPRSKVLSDMYWLWPKD